MTWAWWGGTRTVFAGAGDDRLEQTASAPGSLFTVFHGEEGDDYGKFVYGAEAYGGVGNDTLEFNGGSGILRDDVLDGGAADDLIRLERFEDGSIDGGPGYDTLSLDFTFTRTKAGGTLQTNLAAKRVVADGFSINIDATVRNIEEVIGSNDSRDSIVGRSDVGERLSGRAFPDVILGGGGDDDLFGGTRNDTLWGGTGDDLLHGGPGFDTLYGQKGNDTASYAAASPDADDGSFLATAFAAVDVDLATGRAASGDGIDTLVGIENVIGGVGDDTIYGDRSTNVLSGGDGNGLMRGRSGDDVLILGRGVDRAFGNAGNDSIVLGEGRGIAYGGGGSDALILGGTAKIVVVDFEAGEVTARQETEVAVWLDNGGRGPRVYEGTALTPQDILETDPAYSNDPSDVTRVRPPDDIDAFQITLTTVTNDVVSEFGQIEVVRSTSSPVIVLASEERDVFDGRAGDNDRLDLRRMGGTVLDLVNGATNQSRLQNDRLLGIDAVLGADERDVIFGTDDAEALFGYGGPDRIEGRGGDDTIDGGLGNDILTGGAGNDAVSGKGGNDVVRGGAGNDTLKGAAARDKLSGGDGRDLLFGDASHDTLSGGAGRDTLVGGAGDDVLFIEDAADVAFGDVGLDEVRSSSTSVDLSRGGGVENVNIFGRADLNIVADPDRDVDNRLIGNNGDNVIIGHGGDDIVRGNGGDDALVGGGGNDVLIGGLGSDRLIGGPGRDDLRYESHFDSRPGAALRDTIVDFDGGSGERDRVNRAAIDANLGTPGNQRFTAIGSAAFSSEAGELRWARRGDDTLVLADVDGDARADFAILIADHDALSAGSFLL